MTGLRVTAADRGKPAGSYRPPPDPEPGFVHVDAPLDERGRCKYPNFNLLPEDAEELIEALQCGLKAYLEYTPGLHSVLWPTTRAGITPLPL